MKLIIKLLLAWAIIIPAYSQKEKKATTYDFPQPVDTKSKEITYQEKQIYYDSIGDVFATNNFPAARLNDFQRERRGFYVAYINAENTPINQIL